MATVASDPKKPTAREPRPEPRHSVVFEMAPPEEMLFSLSPDGRRRFMHPVVHKGHYWKIRRVIAWALMVLFFTMILSSHQ